MIDLGPHAIFILSSYGFVAVTVFGLVAITYFDAKRQKARLKHQEQLRSAAQE